MTSLKHVVGLIDPQQQHTTQGKWSAAHVLIPKLSQCVDLSQCMQVCDLKALTDIAHAHGAIVMVDNSIMTPIFQKPLDLGADISMVSATKFVGGHSDVTGGILSFKDPELAKQYAAQLFELCVVVFALAYRAGIVGALLQHINMGMSRTVSVCHLFIDCRILSRCISQKKGLTAATTLQGVLLCQC